MKVLIACEFSGTVREAFKELGHDAWSCDLLPTEIPGQHFQCDVREVINSTWDLMIAHPPCTYLAVSGARWWKDRQQEQREALEFVSYLLEVPVPRVALENPVGKISTAIRPPDQYIHPWMFGQGETKKTGLWLRNLPLLTPTNIVDGRDPRIWKLPPSEDRWKERSKTYSGIAKAMAEQWSFNV